MEEDEDIKILEVKKPKVQKKMTSWVSSSFDDFVISQPSKTVKTSNKPSSQSCASIFQTNNKGTCLSQGFRPNTGNDVATRKRTRVDIKSHSNFPPGALNSNLWAEIYKPSNKWDLAVHKKKVEEICDWLSQKLSKVNKHAAPILVLTGPPGAGKTACINMLCQEMGVSLQQWENTSNQFTGEDFNSSAPQERSKVDVYTSQSQATHFHNFLLRANKYNPLFGSGQSNTQGDCRVKNQKTVILVEEVPNVFHRDTAQLQAILRKYRHNGQSPLVFIVTECNSSNGNMQKLFPKDLQNELHVTHINVNPVAPTMMMKCLNKIVSLSSGQKNFFAPSQSVLEMIVQGSAGDLRAALNMLQFAGSKNDTFTLNELQVSGMKVKKRGSVSSKHRGTRNYKGKSVSNTNDESQSIVGVKDTSVFLFHAVGKVLYFKRGNPIEFPDHMKLPPHLSLHDRDPLLLDPEEIVSKVHISPDFFSSFLHENYVNFITSMDDLEKATEYFSHADCISAVWTSRDVLENYSVSLTTRGFIHSNSSMSHHDSVRKNHGWRPLHKSQWFPTVKQATQNSASARQLFRGCHWEPEILCTELIPFIHFTNPTLHDPGQIGFVNQMTQFSGKTNVFRSRVEQLNEKDALDEEDIDETMSIENNSAQNQGIKSISGSTKEMLGVDESMWGSDWEADDDDLLGSQNKVNVVSENDVVDFTIEEFDED